MVKQIFLIIVIVVIYDIAKPKVISFFYKYISGKRIYWSKENKTLYYFTPFFTKMGWKCTSGISKPITLLWKKNK